MRYLKAIKNNGTLFLAMRVVCFLVLIYLLFRRLDNEQDWSFKKGSTHLWSLVLFVLLIPINWGLEAMKYQRMLHVLDISTSRKIFWQSFSAGIVSGMLTPNMLGNFIGRNMYFQRKHRPSLVLLTLWSNNAQFVCSIVFGALSVVLLWRLPFEGNTLLVVGSLVVLMIAVLLFYFFGEHLVEYFFSKRSWVVHLKSLNIVPRLRIYFVVIGLFRHLLFTLQFILVLYALGCALDFSLLLWTWQSYLWLTLAPSLFMGKLVVRESINVWVLSSVGIGAPIAILASFIIWLGNLFLPTMVAVLFTSKPNQ
jgi:hypothetical protein